MTPIEILQRKIQILKDSISPDDTLFAISAVHEEIDELEKEILDILDTDPEYQQQAQERLDTINDLNNSQI